MQTSMAGWQAAGTLSCLAAGAWGGKWNGVRRQLATATGKRGSGRKGVECLSGGVSGRVLGAAEADAAQSQFQVGPLLSGGHAAPHVGEEQHHSFQGGARRGRRLPSVADLGEAIPAGQTGAAVTLARPPPPPHRHRGKTWERDAASCTVCRRGNRRAVPSPHPSPGTPVAGS